MIEKRIAVTFRDKSTYQKDDCITDCGGKSTLEAVAAGKGLSASIRCCAKPACKRQAAKLARQAIRSAHP